MTRRLLISVVLVSMVAGCAPPKGQTPIVLGKLKHEEALFGWAPPFQRNVPSFDHRNRAYIRSRAEDLDSTAFVHALSDGAWAKRGFLDAVKKAYPTFVATRLGGGWWPSRVWGEAPWWRSSCCAWALV